MRPRRFHIRFEREVDGRWIASVDGLPGCHAYGATRGEAKTKAQALALHYLAFKLEDGARSARPASLFTIAFAEK